MGLTRRQGEGLRRISLVLLMIGVLFLIGFSIAMGLSGGKDLALGLGVSSLGALLLAGVSYGVGKHGEYRESDEEESAGNDWPVVSDVFSGVQSHLINAVTQVAHVEKQTAALQLRFDEEQRKHQVVSTQFTAESERIDAFGKRVDAFGERVDALCEELEEVKGMESNMTLVKIIKINYPKIKAYVINNFSHEERLNRDFPSKLLAYLNQISEKKDLNDDEKEQVKEYQWLKMSMKYFKNELEKAGDKEPKTAEELLLGSAMDTYNYIMNKQKERDQQRQEGVDDHQLEAESDDDVGITNGVN